MEKYFSLNRDTKYQILIEQNQIKLITQQAHVFPSPSSVCICICLHGRLIFISIDEYEQHKREKFIREVFSFPRANQIKFICEANLIAEM